MSVLIFSFSSSSCLAPSFCPFLIPVPIDYYKAQSTNADCKAQIELEFNLKRKANFIGQLILTEDGHAFGPALNGNDDYLEFFFSNGNLNDKDESLKKQSQRISTREEISYDQSFLSYKHFEIDDRKLCMINLMKNCPQKSIALGNWQFLKFVGHSR